MPTDDELRGLVGTQVAVQLTPAGGGARLQGIKDGHRPHSVHSQRIATVERQG